MPSPKSPKNLKPSPASQAPTTLLLGTAHALSHLSLLLSNETWAGRVVGCLLPDESLDRSSPHATLPTLGGWSALSQVVDQHSIEQVLISAPVAMAQRLGLVAQELEQRGIPWQFMPTLADQLAGRVAAPWVAQPTDSPSSDAGQSLAIPVRSPLWSVSPAQLLDRHPHPLDEQAIRQTIQDKTVLITGSGGSIGSELARIVARFKPAKLVLLERAENSLFEIDRDIAWRFPHQARAAVLHDITDAPRTLAVLMAHKPQVIFHAAAHKHVPMMEEHPAQAIENNFYGTRSIADAACKTGVDRFVMISTDKAVNPSSVMGASKRLAELYIQYLNSRCDTTYCMVRFGNVLGSACSVIPIWSQQLAQGGPLTVTHPDMTRYFMTIPEAAGLVLQSAALSNIDGRGGGEVFLLNMGEPIRIVDLARRFIRSQGLEPDRDIAIRFTGIRPGEKMFEELSYQSEDMSPTLHKSIRIWHTTPPDPQHMRRIIATFDRLRGSPGVGAGHVSHHWQHIDRQQIMDTLHSAVPEMVAPASDPQPLPAAG